MGYRLSMRNHTTRKLAISSDGIRSHLDTDESPLGKYFVSIIIVLNYTVRENFIIDFFTIMKHTCAWLAKSN